MHFTLIGALRSIDRLQRRSDFYRAWEVATRTSEDVGRGLAEMEAPAGADLLAARDHLLDGIAKGRPVGVSMKLRPDLFPPLDQLITTTGESFGTAHDSFRLLSEWYLRDFTRLGRVRAWVGLPLVAAVVASFVLPFPLLWDRGGPAYSGAIVAGLALTYGLGGIPVSLLYSIAGGLDRIKRPRFAWTLAMGLEAGLTFAGASRLAASVGGMTAVGRHLDRIPSKDLKTMSLTAMLDGSGIWPAMLDQVRKADEASEYLSTLRVFAANLESPP